VQQHSVQVRVHYKVQVQPAADVHVHRSLAIMQKFLVHGTSNPCKLMPSFNRKRLRLGQRSTLSIDKLIKDNGKGNPSPRPE